MPEFFLELFSEEMPARLQLIAAEALCNVARSLSDSLDLDAAFDSTLKSFSGPRRIAVTAILPKEKKGSVTEIRGPRVGAPDAALNGFLGKYTAQREDLIIEQGFYILRQSQPSVSAWNFVVAKLPEYLAAQLRWPKTMRWGDSGDFAWIRPLRRVVCLLDGEVLPFALGPVYASNKTEGHRILGSGVFTVSSSKDWIEKLNANYVVADYHERFDLIQLGVGKKAGELGLKVVEDESLVGEVSDLVEWPVPLIGKIDYYFMDLPPEVRELSMKVNQKYFALRDVAGDPAPYFAFVANLEAPDGGAAIIAGNERVLRARLADARHFWDMDLKTPLDALLPKLDKITFHSKIGTQLQRSERIGKLAGQIAESIGADITQTVWAGRLCKADLVTGMVGEFPELQGILGGYYAERYPRAWDGAVVGPAIKAHYQPKGPTDRLPNGPVAICVALADKLDTLVEFFRIGETPTGSGDPYALRRAALGVIRLILENSLRLPLKPFLGGDRSLFDFMIERLRVKLRNEGKRFDVLDAVLAAGVEDDLVRLMKRVDALGSMLNTIDGKSLLAAYKRAANILKIEDAKDGPHTPHASQDLFEMVEEYRLLHGLKEAQEKTINHIDEGNFTDAMILFAQLRAPIDDFFSNVKVNAEPPELRLNRLRLLVRFRNTIHQIADFSKIEG